MNTWLNSFFTSLSRLTLSVSLPPYRTHTLSHAHPCTHTHAVLVRTPTFNTTTQEAATSYNILSVAAQQEKVVSWMDFFSFQLLGRIRRDWYSRTMILHKYRIVMPCHGMVREWPTEWADVSEMSHPLPSTPSKRFLVPLELPIHSPERQELFLHIHLVDIFIS